MHTHIFPKGHFALLMKIKIMPGGLLDKPNNGIYNTCTTLINTVKGIYGAPEAYARSDGCKKHKKFSRQPYSFLEATASLKNNVLYVGKICYS